MDGLHAILQAASRIAAICVAAICPTLGAMRAQALLPVAVAFSLAAPSAAWGDVPHTVAPAESLWSVAKTDGLSVSQLAAANRLSSTSHLVAGTTLMIPSQGHHPSGDGATRSSVTDGNGANRGSVAGPDSAINITAVVQANIGSIQANIGSSSQYNTADGSAVEVVHPSGGNGRHGNARVARGLGGMRAATGDHGSAGLGTGALASAWNRFTELGMPATLARTWLSVLERVAEGAAYRHLFH